MTAHIIFGEMGSGKSFHGRKIATSKGIPYFEGDDYLPAHLKARVESANPLTVGDVELFVNHNLLPSVLQLARTHKEFVLSQALYSRNHRQAIRTVLEQSGVQVLFYWVKPVSLRLQVRALFRRSRGFKWVLVMLISKPWFQKPEGHVTLIDNDFGCAPS